MTAAPPADWPDLPGVTALDGRPALPRAPAQVMRALSLVFDGARNGLRKAEMADLLGREVKADRARLEGLLDWLPSSHMIRWTADGRVVIDPLTDPHDLALRYTAWAATRSVPAEWAEATKKYTKAIGDLAADLDKTRTPLSIPPGDLTPAAPPPAPPRVVPLVHAEVTARIRRLIAALDDAFAERRPHVRFALLAMLAGHHVLLLGPPGTAKSALARALCTCFTESLYFEYLLSRFTHPDELFGPVSIPGLKTEDYRRLTEGFLPQAHIAFLDEIFKANSAILNNLLTIVNERVFHHGRHRDAVPLIGLIGASNELPDPEGGLEALYDRFLVRLSVPPVGAPESFLRVASGQAALAELFVGDRLTPTELAQIRAAAEQVVVPPEVEAALVSLWRKATEGEWLVSDRRWRQAVGFLKVAAATAGRRKVIPLDLLLLEPVLSHTPDQAPTVRDALVTHLTGSAVPTHDLRAQWFLLELDRVAPVGAMRPVAPKIGGNMAVRLLRRRENLNRFIAHHRRAVEELATDRERVESNATDHPWLATLPPQVLSEHLAASRDLARILSIAEKYRAALENPTAAVAALVRSLPESSKRKFGFSSVCVLRIREADVSVGITLGGEREELPTGQQAANLPSATNVAELPILETNAAEFLHCVEGSVEQAALLRTIPVHAMRQSATALGSVIRALNHDPVPRPPPLPPP
jgi:MoxR-like ATPase